ncbi:hypothetical protein AS9A_3804 [Hoyosella subflava DQS3-9A1]|uniref:Uncharacterized protein n=1 Tax=Hoyosella subflava (strain DSM 45089 / JCM 17490 / NBRC 109087 / DQS3-9A1) TaxID=443218 RepID=F6EFX8_HOYSD|nr:hypothetical protein AS9A_3804 [Hoyosella subflava DQS3-9A1]
MDRLRAAEIGDAAPCGVRAELRGVTARFRVMAALYRPLPGR